MKKKENILYRNRFVVISFFATAFIWLIIYLLSGVGIFGDNTILRMDLYHQYCPLFAELYDKITSGNLSTYSWESGLGSSFWGNYFNYLSSPIGFIVVLFGHKNVPEAIAAMMMIKGALSSATLTYYLKKSQKNHSISTITFGIMYSFCAYVLAYYWDIMWLDAVVLLPIVLLGIERIIDNGFIWTFTGALALTLFSNYYMSYMICIFSVFYFLYYYFISYPAKAELNTTLSEAERKKLITKLKNRRFFRSGVRFAFAAFLAAGLMAFCLIPTYTILQACSATSSSFPQELKTYFNIFDFFANHLSSLETTIRSSGDDVLPNVYCGLLTIILAPMYFFTKSISKKEKVATLVILAIFFISFNINYLNYIWHGFHFPNDLPYRFSFIYSFILVLIAYKTFVRLNEFTSRQIGLSATALVALVILISKVESKNVDDRAIYISLVFAVIYAVVLTVFKDKKYEKSAVAVILCVFVACEVIVADTQSIKNSITAQSYESDYDEFRSMKSTLDTIEGGDTSYRMELSDLRTRMDGCWFGYNSASVFSSMAYEATAKLQDRLGEMSNGINSYTYNPQTPVFNMMHSIKYVVDNNDLISNNPYYEKVGSTEKYTAYKTKYYLPIAFGVNSDIKDWNTQMDVNADYVNPFYVQGDFFSLATGQKDSIFRNITFSSVTYTNINPFNEPLNSNSYQFQKTTNDTDGSVTFFFKTVQKGNIYVFYNIDSGSDKDVTFASGDMTLTAPCSQDYVVDLGYFNKGETITVNIPFEANSGTMRLYATYMDEKVLEKGYKKLANNVLNVTNYEDTLIEGTMSTKEDCVLYTSIPYDEGWKVYIDGEKVSEEDYINIGGGFLGVDVSKGNHEIKLKYEVSNLKGAAVISVFSLGMLIVAIIWFTIEKKRKWKFRFAPIDNRYFEYEIRAEKKIRKPSMIKQKAPEKVFAREIIAPKETTLKREIIEPKNTIVVENVETEGIENED